MFVDLFVFVRGCVPEGCAEGCEEGTKNDHQQTIKKKTQKKTKTATHSENTPIPNTLIVPNIKNNLNPKSLTNVGVILLITKFQSHWEAEAVARP